MYINHIQKIRPVSIIRFMLLLVLTFLLGFSFEVNKGQSSFAATTYTPTAYMDSKGNWMGGTDAQHDQ